MSEAGLTIGEIYTGLLQHSSAMPPRQAATLLSLVEGEQVSRSSRPIHYVRSPQILTGVDCALPLRGGATVRAVGTIAARASLTGGHVLQASASVTVTRSAVSTRQPWSHYLSRHGAVETIGRADPAAVAEGFLLGGQSDGQLSLGSVCHRVVDRVHQRGVDRRVALRVSPSTLRFAITAGGRSRVHFAVDGDQRRLQLNAIDAPLPTLVEWCEDVARHDWLLASVLALIERSRLGIAPRAEVVRQVVPVLEYLGHLWSPGRRPAASHLWRGLDRELGLRRQWRAAVGRIRDQVALAALDAATANNTD